MAKHFAGIKKLRTNLLFLKSDGYIHCMYHASPDGAAQFHANNNFSDIIILRVSQEQCEKMTMKPGWQPFNCSISNPMLRFLELCSAPWLGTFTTGYHNSTCWRKGGGGLRGLKTDLGFHLNPKMTLNPIVCLHNVIVVRKFKPNYHISSSREASKVVVIIGF